MGIRWYKCVPGAPTLGWESNINSLDWAGFPWLRTGQGEVFNAPRTYHQEPPVPGALGQHVCGTEEDFRDGELYLPDLPPVVYSPEGLPVCCGTVGGVVLGGTGEVPQITGGVEVGGTRGPSPHLPISCSDAGFDPQQLGVTYWEYKQVNSDGVTRFLYYDNAGPGTYTLNFDVAVYPDTPRFVWVYQGVFCTYAGDLYFGEIPTDPITVTVGSGLVMIVEIHLGFPQAYYMQITVT